MDALPHPGGFPIIQHGSQKIRLLSHAVSGHTEPPNPKFSCQSWEVALEDFVLYLGPLYQVQDCPEHACASAIKVRLLLHCECPGLRAI